jgi:hypothetical protein
MILILPTKKNLEKTYTRCSTTIEAMVLIKRICTALKNDHTGVDRKNASTQAAGESRAITIDY